MGSRVDTRLFRPREGGAPALDAVMVGGLADVKNHATVLRAWPRVLRELPDARLAIAGEGAGRPRLEALVASLGLGRHVDLLGRVPHARVAGLLASARCLLQPSWSEGHPRAVLEGMASGLPVVCTDIPAHREIVTPETGRLVPPHDARLWAGAVVATLSDPARAAEMGARGRAVAVARHDLGTGLDRYAGFIRAVAERHQRTGAP
ncbi:hypothetical protein MPTA5024_24290 [Microbispora sp. ATCC PTA-5024]|nr:hypothetical protein MPTA5024_24290 [Microbispora sp. ATCC PTA-5024]